MRIGLSVSPVTSDQIDKLEFVAHPSIATRALIHRAHRLTCCIVSEPCGSSVGDYCPAPPDRSPATLCEAAKANACRSPRGHGCERSGKTGSPGSSSSSLYRCGLAPQRLSLVLELEDSTWKIGTTERAQTSAGVDSNDEPRKSSWEFHAFMVSCLNSASRSAKPAWANIWSVVGPPSQTLRTFLENRLKSMVSVDFFVVPTFPFQILYVFSGVGA